MNKQNNSISDSTKAKTPAPQLKLLNMLEGEWVIKGNNFGAAPGGAGSEVNGKMTNEWLKGNFFMTTKWEYQFESGEHVGYGALGFNDATNNFFVRNYDDMGYERLYEISIYKNTWNYSGDQERATMVFNDTQDAYEESWEILKNGSWQPLCKRFGKRKV